MGNSLDVKVSEKVEKIGQEVWNGLVRKYGWGNVNERRLVKDVRLAKNHPEFSALLIASLSSASERYANVIRGFIEKSYEAILCCKDRKAIVDSLRKSISVHEKDNWMIRDVLSQSEFIQMLVGKKFFPLAKKYIEGFDLPFWEKDKVSFVPARVKMILAKEKMDRVSQFAFSLFCDQVEIRLNELSAEEERREEAEEKRIAKEIIPVMNAVLNRRMEKILKSSKVFLTNGESAYSVRSKDDAHLLMPSNSWVVISGEVYHISGISLEKEMSIKVKTVQVADAIRKAAKRNAA